MGKGSKAPAGYQPTWQAGADQNYQQLLQNATPWATSLPGQVIPGGQNVVNAVQNNPYYPGAQQGAVDVANLAQSTVAPGMFNAANSLYNSGMQGLNFGLPMLDQLKAGGDASMAQGQDFYGRAMAMMPGAVYFGYDQAKPFYRSGMEKANTAWDQTQAAMPYLTGGMPEAQQLLDNGFDPQSMLYDREYQKMQDQQNAINSMYGVSSSPYGAGVAGDASRNFNLDWGDRQLSRQLAALGGYGQHTGQVTSNMTNLLNTGGNQYNALSQGAVGGYNSLVGGAVDRGTRLMDTASTALNRGVDNQRLNYGTGADIYQGMNTNAANMLGAASAHGTDALNTLYTSTQLPNSTYLANQDSQMAALMQFAQLAGLSLAPSTSMMDASNRYLQTGQNATQLAQNAAQINNANRAAQMQGLTSALGTIAGLALAPMTGGMSLFMSGAAAGGRGG